MQKSLKLAKTKIFAAPKAGQNTQQASQGFKVCSKLSGTNVHERSQI